MSVKGVMTLQQRENNLCGQEEEWDQERFLTREQSCVVPEHRAPGQRQERGEHQVDSIWLEYRITMGRAGERHLSEKN